MKVMMFANEIRIDGAATALANWEEAEAAIRALDGHNSCNVILSAGPDAYCGIDGGEADRVRVVITFNDDDFFYLVNPRETSTGTYSVNIAGQVCPIKARNCVPVEMALWAARTFAERGEKDPALTWE